MKKSENSKPGITRRKILSETPKAAAALYLLSAGCSKEEEFAKIAPAEARRPEKESGPGLSFRASPDRVLLKNGLIVDGTGTTAWKGDLMINGDKIEEVSRRDIDFPGKTIDCSGKAVAPGFIDMHSHMDWTLPVRGAYELKAPFAAQGITTFVGGNCGFGIAGYRKNTRFRELLQARAGGVFNTDDACRITWNTMDEYFTAVKKTGLSHNLKNLTGYGTTRVSIKGYDPSPMNPAEMKEELYLLEEAMEQGAAGVSLGLQYEPGVFSKLGELRQAGELVKKKDKILAVHLKAYSSLSGTYPLSLFGEKHNIQALKEMIEVAEQSGARVQLSHLIFVGESTWDTCDEALELIDRAVSRGVDIRFDTYGYHCGTSIINVVMPEWILNRLPQVYDDRWAMTKLYGMFTAMQPLLGWGFNDIQITKANHPELEEFNGMFISQIAEERDMSEFDCFIDIARKSHGRARVLNHRYSSPGNLFKMIRHPHSLFMTDAWVTSGGVQNPSAFSSFPRVLRLAREYGLLSLEDAVRKMTGASAERFKITDRGILRKGLAADIVVFDPDKTGEDEGGAYDAAPLGIDRVFINGRPVLEGGKSMLSENPGRVLV